MSSSSSCFCVNAESCLCLRPATVSGPHTTPTSPPDAPAAPLANTSPHGNMHYSWAGSPGNHPTPAYPQYYAPYYSPWPPTTPPPPPAVPPINAPLGNVTAAIVNAVAPAQVAPSTTQSSSASKKRKNTAQGPSNSRKRRTDNAAAPNENQAPSGASNFESAAQTSTSTPSVPTVAVHGSGPQACPTPPPVSPPAASQSHGSLTAKPTTTPKTAATNVWFFVRGLKSRDKSQAPASMPPPSLKQPCTNEFPVLGCRLCLHPSWTVWKNGDGQTDTIRRHMQTNHLLLWEELVIAYKLKDWETVQERQSARKASMSDAYEPFSLEGFNDRLLSFIAADDQSLGVVECEEFRELLEFVCPDLREPGAIPRRTKLKDTVTSGFRRQYQRMVSEIENSLGRVSFTSDVWSRKNLQSYMAVTAHYLANVPSPRGPTLSLQTRLIAFRLLHGSHTGANLGKEFMKILEEVNCLQKISMITLDNASNNQTMCAELETELEKIGIPFDRKGNRVRCFPHVINIAVQTGLKHFTQLDDTLIGNSDDDIDSATFGNAELLDDLFYFNALRSDVVSKARRTVNWCRASGQRRERFSSILRAGNESGGWGTPKVQLRDLQLKNDCDTRWSSLFGMVDTFLELYPVIAKLVSETPDLTDHIFTEAEITVLQDIRIFLQVFHYVQELVSAEKTPTLSLVLPLYEMLVSMLKDLALAKPKLAHAIRASIAKLEEYLNISRGTKMYILAMVVNPKIKFSWLKDNWAQSDYERARSTVTDALFEHEKANRGQSSRDVPPLPTQVTRTLVKSHSISHEASAQASGFERLKNLRQDLKKSASLSAIPDGPAINTNLAPSAEDLARQADEAGMRRVEAEIKAYEDAGLIDDAAPLDLLRFWQDHMTTFPLLYRIALDVLPAQASAVPCERVFSSSKETDTNRRSNLSPERMEQLQILKFGVRGHRLRFMDDIAGEDRQVIVINISPDKIRDLYERGEIAKLESYVEQSWNVFHDTPSV